MVVLVEGNTSLASTLKNTGQEREIPNGSKDLKKSSVSFKKSCLNSHGEFDPGSGRTLAARLTH
ncbi:MAG TPA: hypothetical protein VIB55_20185, partial [Longimicrobium sp.]